MALFARKPLAVDAVRVFSPGYVLERGVELPVRPGDWLTRGHDNKVCVISDEIFRQRYVSVNASGERLLETPERQFSHTYLRQDFSRFAGFVTQFRKKELMVSAERVIEPCTVNERGSTMAVGPGDWLLTDVDGSIYPLGDEDFRKTYKPADAAAIALWNQATGPNPPALRG